MDALAQGPENRKDVDRHSVPARLRARIAALLTDGGDRSVAQRMAGTAFLIRVASAAMIFFSQVLLARWMGAFEFGVYIYVWTWVLVIGDMVHLGLASAAQRFIPQYTHAKAIDSLRGFLVGSRWIVFIAATLVGLLGAVGIRTFEPWIARYEVAPLYLACATLPFFSLSSMLDGIARSYNWVNLALLPPYLVRPTLMLAIMMILYLGGREANATTAMMAAIVATWAAAVVQLVWLGGRLRRTVPQGRKVHHVGEWLATSLPILMVGGFYTLLTYVDVLVLRHFRPPEEVAIYHAASKSMALAAFVYFSVAAAVAHKFAEYHAKGDRDMFAGFVRDATRWTFWPSLAAVLFLLAIGPLVLRMFGPDFTQGYVLMFIFAAGLLARASVGPAETLLNMTGEHYRCGLVYFLAFAVNLVLCTLLIPALGMVGAATSLAVAMVAESTLLVITARRRLGLNVWIGSHGKN